MVRSYKKSVQGEPRTYEGVQKGDMFMSSYNGHPVPIDSVNRADVLVYPPGWAQWRASLRADLDVPDTPDYELMPHFDYTARDRGLARERTWGGDLNNSMNGYREWINRQGAGTSLTAGKDLVVSGVPNSVLREVRIAATPRPEVRTDMGQLVRSLNKMQVLAPGRTRAKEVAIAADLIAKHVVVPKPKPNPKKRTRDADRKGKGKVPRTEDIDGINDAFAAMRFNGPAGQARARNHLSAKTFM